MEKLSKNNLKELWEMKNLTVKEFIQKLSAHPDMKFLLTAFGIWWICGFLLTATIGINVVMYVFRIFKLVLGG